MRYKYQLNQYDGLNPKQSHADGSAYVFSWVTKLTHPLDCACFGVIVQYNTTYPTQRGIP
jgi:hypothetical protein